MSRASRCAVDRIPDAPRRPRGKVAIRIVYSVVVAGFLICSDGARDHCANVSSNSSSIIVRAASTSAASSIEFSSVYVYVSELVYEGDGEMVRRRVCLVVDA